MEELTVAQLRAEAKRLGISTLGDKATLIEAIAEYRGSIPMQEESPLSGASDSVQATPAISLPQETMTQLMSLISSQLR